MRHGRRDENHKAIVNELREQGFSVLDLANVGAGCPDLLVGKAGYNLLVEVKKPKGPRGGGGGTLTEAQETFIRMWRGPVLVADTSERIVRWWSGEAV